MSFYIWDSTCVDSFSPSALALTATEPGSASRSAEVRKNLRYEGLFDRWQSPLNPLVCLDETQTPSFPDWVT